MQKVILSETKLNISFVPSPAKQMILFLQCTAAASSCSLTLVSLSHHDFYGPKHAVLHQP